MLRSMTGFGKASDAYQNKKITFEAKSVNSKQMDLNLKIPYTYKDKELELRNEAMKLLARGKIDIYMNVEIAEAGNNGNVFNAVLIKGYFNQLKEIADGLQIKNTDDLLPVILRMPEVMKLQAGETDAEEWKCISGIFSRAIGELDKSRLEEGKSLEQDICARIKLIGSLLGQVEKYEKPRIESIKAKIKQGFAENVKPETIDQNRFEQELIYYLEKIDITEEQVRLANHLKYFCSTCNDEDMPGKKLGFIAQEIGREINTLGSKANEVNIQKIVIQMKDELEKIKEQLLNIL